MILSDEDFSSRIKVASPCKVPWSTMSGDERIKHCQQCKKNVYNISEMTKDEAIDLLARAEGKERVCIAFYRRHDGTVITSDCPYGVKLARKAKAKVIKIIAATVTLLATLLPASAKEKAESIVDSVNEAPHGKLYNLNQSNLKTEKQKSSTKRIMPLPKITVCDFIEESPGCAEFIYGEAIPNSVLQELNFKYENRIKTGKPDQNKKGTLLSPEWYRYRKDSLFKFKKPAGKQPAIKKFDFTLPDQWHQEDAGQKPEETKK